MSLYNTVVSNDCVYTVHHIHVVNCIDLIYLYKLWNWLIMMKGFVLLLIFHVLATTSAQNNSSK